MTLTRQSLLIAMKTALEAEPNIRAMWEGGSAARGQTDQWSDVDAVVVCKEYSVQAVFDIVESALEELSPLDLVWRVPEPTWHGHAQRLYRLEGAPRHLLVDLVVMKAGTQQRFLVPERHGHAVVYFDKGSLIKPTDFAVEQFRDEMAAALADLQVRFEMLGCLVDKELERGRPLDAMGYYLGLTLPALLAVLGMRYRPFRYDFGRRYTRDDFPANVADEVEALHFVSDAEDLAAKHERTQALFRETVDVLDIDSLALAEMASEIRGRTNGSK